MKRTLRTWTLVSLAALAAALGCTRPPCPTGIAAAGGTGAAILVVTATHRGETVSPHPHIRDYGALSCAVQQGGLRLRIDTLPGDGADR